MWGSGPSGRATFIARKGGVTKVFPFPNVLQMYAVLDQFRGLTGGVGVPESVEPQGREKHSRTDLTWLDESRQRYSTVRVEDHSMAARVLPVGRKYRRTYSTPIPTVSAKQNNRIYKANWKTLK